jgi:arylsulfatase A-like enzyme
MLPPLDQGVAALLDDLAESGLLDDTLVMMLGEFGRSPKISTTAAGRLPGRNHWGACFFGLFAGGGVRGGQVIGKSDKVGGSPLTQPYSANDVGATVYQVLGIDPASEIRDSLGRPLRLNQGTAIKPLFTG